VIMGPTEYWTKILLLKTITKPPPCVTAGTRHSGLYASLGVLQTQTLPDVGNSVKADNSSDYITSTFPAVWYPGFMVVTRVSNAFSNQRVNNCIPTVDVWFMKLTSVSFYGNSVFKTNIQFCGHLCCSSSVTFRNSPSQCTTISLCQCLFSPIVPLPWYCLPMIRVSDIILETVLSIHLIMWHFCHRCSTKTRTNDLSTFKIGQISPFSDSFTRTIIQHSH
jgi:hypothetical protein